MIVMHLPVTSQCIKRFRRNRRAFVSFCIIAVLSLVSFAAELIANDKPLLIGYNGKLWFFAAYFFYPDTMFGGTGESAPDYKALAETERFASNKNNFIIFPLISYGPGTRDPDQPVPSVPVSPCPRHLLGTDAGGRDVLVLLLYGFRASMTFALVLLAIEIVIGLMAGMCRVYCGRIAGFITRGFTGILSALPVFFIVMLAGSLLGQGFPILVMMMSIFKWIGFSRYTGAWFSRIKKYQFLDAAKIAGTGKIKMFFSEILPNLVFPVISFAPFSIITTISCLTGLDFLRCGLPAPGWGELLRQGTEHLSGYWLPVFPLLALFITLLLLAFIGKGLRDSMDQEGHAAPEWF